MPLRSIRGRLARPASARYNLAKTLTQSLTLWAIFFGLLPAGMALLLIWLQGRRRIDEGVGSAADGLLANMAVLFVPVGVGAMAYPGLFRDHWLFILVAVTAGTAVTLAATAVTARFCSRFRTRIMRQTDATV